MKDMKDICCVFLCKEQKFMAAYNINHLQRMIDDSKYDCDLFIYDNVDFDIYRKQFNYNYTFGPSYVGVTFLILLDCYQKHKDEYKYYMFFEDDLIFNSERNLFDDICDNFIYNNDNKDIYDVIFQNQRKKNYYWYWGIHNHLSNIKRQCYIPYSGLLNIYLMNQKTIEDLIKFINKGNWAHHEYLINSYILKNKDKYNIGYLNNIYKVYSIANRLIHHKNYKEYDLIHPIKTLEEYSELL